MEFKNKVRRTVMSAWRLVDTTEGCFFVNITSNKAKLLFDYCLLFICLFISYKHFLNLQLQF